MFNKILEGLSDIKEGELVKRTYKNGEVVEETREYVDWKPNAADLDIVLVGCKECGNQFDTPWDTLMFLNNPNSQCGQCGKTGTFEVIADPSPNKKERYGNNSTKSKTVLM